MDDTSISRLLQTEKKVLVIGLSKDGSKPSNQIPNYLLSAGYEVTGINPTVSTSAIGVIPVFQKISDLPVDFSPGILVVFRPSAEAGAAARQALEAKPGIRAVWLQLGIVSEEAGKLAESRGIAFVQDRCIMVEHKRLFGV